jgi:hypothetical protein
MRTSQRPMEITAGAILFLLLSFLLVSVVRAHSSQVRREREAAASIARFHSLLNAGEFDKICDEIFLCTVPEDSDTNWDTFFQDIRNHAGPFQRVNKSEIKVYSEPTMALVTYFSSFEKEDFKETFYLICLSDGVFRVRIYKPEYKTAARSSFAPSSDGARATEVAEPWEAINFLDPTWARSSWVFPQ